MTTIVYSRAAGGHYFHARVQQESGTRTREALCGFAPSSAYSASRRGVWRYTPVGELVPSRVCPKCAKRIPEVKA